MFNSKGLQLEQTSRCTSWLNSENACNFNNLQLDELVPPKGVTPLGAAHPFGENTIEYNRH
tara:strand:- start:51 stop:233 length:183 start_codon:yes stop_codon:yes gene_type:complete